LQKTILREEQLWERHPERGPTDCNGYGGVTYKRKGGGKKGRGKGLEQGKVKGGVGVNRSGQHKTGGTKQRFGLGGGRRGGLGMKFWENKLSLVGGGGYFYARGKKKKQEGQNGQGKAGRKNPSIVRLRKGNLR